MSKKLVAFILFGFLSFNMASFAFAEAGSGEKSVTGFFRRLFNYPVKTTEKAGEMTANTLNNTGEKVLSGTGENIASGDLGGVIAQPVVGTLETTGQTLSETVQIPSEAAEATEEAAQAAEQQQ